MNKAPGVLQYKSILPPAHRNKNCQIFPSNKSSRFQSQPSKTIYNQQLNNPWEKKRSRKYLEEEAAELGAEGVHLLGTKLVLLLPHGLPLLLILDEPRAQLAHLNRSHETPSKPQSHIIKHLPRARARLAHQPMEQWNRIRRRHLVAGVDVGGADPELRGAAPRAEAVGDAVPDVLQLRQRQRHCSLPLSLTLARALALAEGGGRHEDEVEVASP